MPEKPLAERVARLEKLKSINASSIHLVTSQIQPFFIDPCGQFDILSNLIKEYIKAFEDCGKKTKEALSHFDETFKTSQNLGEMTVFSVNMLTQDLSHFPAYFENCSLKLGEYNLIIRQSFMETQLSVFARKSDYGCSTLLDMEKNQNIISETIQL